jgi:hypothetical protein
LETQKNRNRHLREKVTIGYKGFRAILPGSENIYSAPRYLPASACRASHAVDKAPVAIAHVSGDEVRTLSKAETVFLMAPCQPVSPSALKLNFPFSIAALANLSFNTSIWGAAHATSFSLSL